MTTFNVHSQCSYVLITSETIQAYHSDPETDPIILKLTCDETTYTIEVDGDSTSWFVDDVAYIKVTSELLGLEQEETVADGVYYVEITIPQETSTTVETGCLFIGCDLRCALIEHLSKYPQSELYKYEIVLQWLNYCDTCSCDYGKLIYNHILNILKDGEKSPCNC